MSFPIFCSSCERELKGVSMANECGHVFHERCLFGAFCPTCRPRRLLVSPYTRLYLKAGVNNDANEDSQRAELTRLRKKISELKSSLYKTELVVSDLNWQQLQRQWELEEQSKLIMTQKAMLKKLRPFEMAYNEKSEEIRRISQIIETSQFGQHFPLTEETTEQPFNMQICERFLKNMKWYQDRHSRITKTQNGLQKEYSENLEKLAELKEKLRNTQMERLTL